MSAAEFFTEVVSSYNRMSESSAGSVPDFRSYCRSRHVSYHAFVRWASTDETASMLLETERKKRHSKRTVQSRNKTYSPAASHKEGLQETPLLYPLHIISNASDPVAGSDAAQIKLHGVRILYPNGVKVTVREADSKGIYFLVHGNG